MGTCDNLSIIAFVLVACLFTALPLIFKVLPMLIVAVLAWEGLGIYLVSTSSTGEVCWILGWVSISIGLLCAFEFIRRSIAGRPTKVTEEDEQAAYFKKIRRYQRRK